MKTMLIASVLVAAVGTVVGNIVGAIATDNATPSPLSFTLNANATEILTANGIWAPNLTAFAGGKPNTDGINMTAEVEKLVALGIGFKDLFHVSANGVGLVADKKAEEDCAQCDLCWEACAATGLFYPV